MLLDEAAGQYLEDGVVDLVVQADLAEEGFLLRNLTRAVQARLAERS